MPTTRLGIVYLEQSQSQKEVTVNDGFNTIDAAVAALALAQTFTNTNTFSGRSDFTETPSATSERGTVNIGAGGFAGGGGHFAGNASGTHLALNAPSGFGGDLANLQVNGVQMFRVGAGGAVDGGSFRQSGGSRGLSGGWAWFVAVVAPPSDADYTLASSEYIAPMIILNTGSWTTGRNIILPATLGGWWEVSNTTAFAATFKTAAGTGITVAANRTATLWCNGTNIFRRTPDVDPTV